MPETWEISEILANPKKIRGNPKVINSSLFGFEFGLRRRTREQLLDLAQDAIEGLEIQLEQNRRLSSVASRIKGQGPNIMRNAKFINGSGKLPAVLNNEDPSFTDQRISQLKGGTLQAGVPALMAEDWKDDQSRAKAEAVRSLVYLGNKEMEEGPKKILRDIIGDLFDYDHDMQRLRRYVDRLQHLKPSMTGKMLRHRVITMWEAGKFDRATVRLTNRLKYQLSSLKRITDHARLAVSAHPTVKGLVRSMSEPSGRYRALDRSDLMPRT
ncbi:hypothetical protein LCI18_004330 [Fusarium solani-melongenae]|uniref:Uncharacterized protein n=1 Tax=Fusarium solani subsp. cucurbitae TaxID=2747967 RepID=A0ACD3YWU5_FUSSC|nr:hypothetical protein LCI18_004330 [Fusarium solani-melongenae]